MRTNQSDDDCSDDPDREPTHGRLTRRDEITLVVSCLLGERDAFHELVRQYSSLIHGAANKAIAESGRDVSVDADDLTERFFLDIWQSPCRVLGSFDPNRGSLGTYLAGVAVRRFTKWLRSHTVSWPARRPRHDTATLDQLHARPTSEFDPVRFVARLLSKLSERSRSLVEARFGLCQESFEEMAKRHGMSKSTAYRHVLRVLRRRLRPIAEEDEINPELD